VIQEALTNVIKHGCASQARVELKRQKRELRFNVTDSGKGFNIDDARLKGRLGLISMKERCGSYMGPCNSIETDERYSS